MNERELESILYILQDAITRDKRAQAEKKMKEFKWNKIKEVQELKRLAKRRRALLLKVEKIQEEETILENRVARVIKVPEYCKISLGCLQRDDNAIYYTTVEEINRWRTKIQVARALKDSAIQNELNEVLKKYNLI